MFPNYNIYPQQMQRLNYLESQLPNSVSLRGRPVSSLDEVKAIPIDFDGAIYYFPDAANNRIYSKQIGLNGQAIYQMYTLTELPSQGAVDTNKFVSQEQFTATIEKVMNQLNEVKQGAKKHDEQESTDYSF